MLINAYGTHRDPLPPLVAHRFLARRYRGDAELDDHLAALGGWALAMTEHGSARAADLVDHVERVWFHWVFETTSDDLAPLETWATRFNVLLFLDDSTLRDPAGRILVANRGDGASEAVSDAAGGQTSDLSATVPRFRSGEARKQRTIDRLDERRIPILDTWPALVNDEEADVRDLGQVVERLVESSWSTEAIGVLQWALGMTDALAYPQHRADADAVAAILQRADLGVLARSGKVRTTAELLDMADLHHRLLWAVVEAPEAQRGPIDGIVPGVVVERWLVFAWLLGGAYQAPVPSEER